tara:strand:+ start:419 stop:610 length:192 start_codon:yes stop_codon:yes gene_type:complete
MFQDKNNYKIYFFLQIVKGPKIKEISDFLNIIKNNLFRNYNKLNLEINRKHFLKFLIETIIPI